LSEIFGGPHGDKYSDLDVVMPAQQVKSITIRSGERVNGVGLVMTDFWRDDHTLYHGGYGGDNETLSLSAGEHVTEIEAHWDEYRSHTRIFYIKFTTDKGNKIEGGTPVLDSANIGKETAPDGYQLGGFVGYAGKELDMVQAIWADQRSW
ncbi:hypothetical protein PHYSODRAFT_487709, partial [Phytophthora sojae]